MQGRAKSCLEMSALHICGRSLGIVGKYLQTSKTYDGTVWDWDIPQRFGSKLMVYLRGDWIIRVLTLSVGY